MRNSPRRAAASDTSPATPAAGEGRARKNTPKAMGAKEDAKGPLKDSHVTEWLARPAAPNQAGALGTLKVVVRVVLILGVTAVLCTLAFLINVIVEPLDPLLARAWLDLTLAGWADAIVGGPVLPHGTEMQLSGELPHPDRRAAVLIANHQLDVDWLYIWELLRVVRAHGSLKIVLLDDMKTVPIVGWAMKLVGFVFVTRGKKRPGQAETRGADISAITRGVADIAKGGKPTVVLIFPEGTTSNVESKEKAELYAFKNGRPQHSLLVVPRSAGFVAALRGFQEAGVALDDVAIYDATVAYAGYTGEIPSWELGFERKVDVDLPNVARLFKGEAPDFVRVHTKAHRASDIFDREKQLPSDADQLACAWLDARWVEKDALMAEFARSGDFDAAKCGDVVAVTPERRVTPFAVFTFAWVAAAASAILAALVTTLLLTPLLFIATLCCVIAMTLALPLLLCAAGAITPLVVASYAAHKCYMRHTQPHGPFDGATETDLFFDADDLTETESPFKAPDRPMPFAQPFEADLTETESPFKAPQPLAADLTERDSLSPRDAPTPQAPTPTRTPCTTRAFEA